MTSKTTFLKSYHNNNNYVHCGRQATKKSKQLLKKVFTDRTVATTCPKSKREKIDCLNRQVPDIKFGW